MEFWELEDHEVAYSWLRAFKSCPGTEFWELEDHEVRYSWLKKESPVFRGTRPDPAQPPWGVMMLSLSLSFSLSLSLSLF
eukprot:6736077-Pyramimonas_sp.AAC.1